MDSFALHLGDCREVLKSIPSGSVDSVVCDPPYELGFMGKEWDGTGIAYDVAMWKEVLRVLKPGGYLLSFGGSRTYHRMACAIEDAGFEIRDQVMWVYGSGFPKSLDVSKAIDKAGGGEGMPENDRKAFAAELRAKREQKGVSRAELAAWFPRYAEVTKNWERLDAGFRVPTEAAYDILVERLGICETWRLRVRAEDKRRLIAEGGIDRRDDGTVIGLGHTGREWEATTERAKQWDGWGTALKPAHEPICVARKPLIGTVAENVLKHGTGAINIDGCRVPVDPKADASQLRTMNRNQRVEDTAGQEWGMSKNGADEPTVVREDGRWPANLIHDGSEEVVSTFPDAKGQQGDLDHQDHAVPAGNAFGQYGPKPAHKARIEADKSAARFFYCAKTSKRERGEGNKHPTVKPIALMCYLCRLVTQKDGVVLDPFMGSGSTGIAAVREGFRFIGIERESEYIEIAKKRICAACNETTENT